jgi:hypothetical protein
MELNEVVKLERQKEAILKELKSQAQEIDGKILESVKSLSDKDLIRYRTKALVERSREHGVYGSVMSPILINEDFCNELAFYILDNFPSTVMKGLYLILKDGVLTNPAEQEAIKYPSLDLNTPANLLNAWMDYYAKKSYEEEVGVVVNRYNLFKFSVSSKSNPSLNDIKQSVDKWASKFEQIFIHDITWAYHDNGPIVSGFA